MQEHTFFLLSGTGWVLQGGDRTTCPGRCGTSFGEGGGVARSAWSDHIRTGLCRGKPELRGVPGSGRGRWVVYCGFSGLVSNRGFEPRFRGVLRGCIGVAVRLGVWRIATPDGK